LPVAAALLILLLPVAIWRVVRQPVRPENGVPSPFALMAAESHLRHIRGQLPLEIESSNPQQISEWFTNKVGFNVKLPSYQESSGQEILYALEGARLVSFQNDYAAYVSYHMKDRLISLVITSELLAHPSGGEEIASRGLRFHYNAIDGLKVITWSDRGLTYALVSDLEERGQQSCFVCHQGTKDQDFIEPLKPH
jgi:anti-sigma factor RsiW